MNWISRVKEKFNPGKDAITLRCKVSLENLVTCSGGFVLTIRFVCTNCITVKASTKLAQALGPKLQVPVGSVTMHISDALFSFRPTGTVKICPCASQSGVSIELCQLGFWKCYFTAFAISQTKKLYTCRSGRKSETHSWETFSAGQKV